MCFFGVPVYTVYIPVNRNGTRGIDGIRIHSSIEKNKPRHVLLYTSLVIQGTFATFLYGVKKEVFSHSDLEYPYEFPFY